jgi:hypothetical protein
MHNAALIRLICGRIHRETEPKRIDELLRLMGAVIRNDPEDMCTLMEFIRKKYAMTFEQSDELPVF